VYISGGIYEQIKHKLVCGYESLGDRKVKNITDPVRVYRVLSDPAAFNKTRKRRENVLILMLGLTLLVIASGILWFMIGQPQSRRNEQASAPASTVPDVPKASSSPEPAVKQAVPQSSPSPAQQLQPTSPPASSSKQAAPLPQSTTSPALPATAPRAPSASSVSEPEMIAIPGASFAMGSNDDPSEKPVHQVTIKSFSIGKFPITVREWNECAANKACGFVANGREDAPITNVSWSDAKQYVSWLATTTRKPYRLPSEAEWEYAARGGTQTKYWWGEQLQLGMANCKDCAGTTADQPLKVGSFKPNPFGLYDMGGGVDQWVEDCWHKNYQGAPTDGSTWQGGDCASHVLRSGSWKNDVRYTRPSNRDNYDTNVRYPTHGFRIALSP
jgi:formylglycine-generating enzyme required for sulfatase activity